VFDVTVKEVRERQPARIDDELAEAVGLENLAELRDEIRQRMQRDYDQIARQRLKRTLLDKLADRYDFPVPPGMVEMEFESIWREYEAQKERQKEMEARAGDTDTAGAETAGADIEGAEAPSEAPAAEATASDAEPGETTASPLSEEEEKAQAEYRRIAERRVRLGLLLAEVGRSNNITVTQEEINQALIREAQSHPGYERQVLDFYRKNPDSMNNLRAPIFEEKVVDLIVELAKAEERKVTPRELMAVAETGEPEGEEKEAAAPQ
jgi:trigger factor